MIGGHDVWLFSYNLLVHSMYSSYLLELSMFNICKKVYVLQLKLVTKFVTFFLSLYRSPSQDEFETFTENFELNLENLLQRNPFLGVAIKDFNAKSNNWFCRGNAGRKCN